MALSDVAKATKSTKPPTVPTPDAPPDIPSAAEAAKANALSIPASGLLAVISAADAGQGPSFPTLAVTGGEAGGMLAPHNSTPDDIANRMPQGKMPVEGVFIGLRTEVSAWPTDYVSRDASQDQLPCWSMAAGANDQDAALLIQDACKNYQYTKGVNKHLFDFTKSQVGHPKPVLQALVWCKALGDLIVVQTPAAYESWIESLRAFMRLADKDTGALTQFPMTLGVTSVPKPLPSSPGRKMHYLRVDVLANAAGVECMNTFKAWRTQLPDERVTQVNDWLAAVDRPMTPNVKEALLKAKSIRA